MLFIYILVNFPPLKEVYKYKQVCKGYIFRRFLFITVVLVYLFDSLMFPNVLLFHLISEPPLVRGRTTLQSHVFMKMKIL
jgi:hypothetical protein